MHNLIHIPDDVRYFKALLIEISAFWGENYTALFKHLVKSPYKPLTQIANRLKELENSDDMKIKKQSALCKCIYERFIESVIYHKKQYFKVKTVNVCDFTLYCDHPNNVVQLHNNKIFVIDSLLNVQSNPATEENIDYSYIYGTVENIKKEVFDFPTSSIDVGMMEVVS